MFERCPEMREPLLQHVQALTPHQVTSSSSGILVLFFLFGSMLTAFCVVSVEQQAHIPTSIMTVLEGEKKPVEAVTESEVAPRFQ